MVGAVRFGPQVEPPATTTLRITQDVRTGEVFRIFLNTLALTVLTLGFYRFWGRTNLRRYVWSHVSVLGDRFEYTGTARELLNGFLRVATVMTVLSVAYFGAGLLLDDAHPRIGIALKVAWSAGLMYLTFVGSYAARRYRLSRTRWRGINARQTGSPWRYATIVLAQWILFVGTLGVHGVWGRMRQTAFELRHTMLGNRAVTFRGRGEDLVAAYLVALILTVPTLGLVHYWYRARELRYVAAHTRWGGLRYAVDVTGWGLFRLGVGNVLLLLLTLGLAWPVTLERRLRFWSDAIVLHGDPELESLAQNESAPEGGEGLADLLDAGAV
jgi:uncharacterized membrane protein YjgN (DUF898 family)